MQRSSNENNLAQIMRQIKKSSKKKMIKSFSVKHADVHTPKQAILHLKDFK